MDKTVNFGITVKGHDAYAVACEIATFIDKFNVDENNYVSHFRYDFSAYKKEEKQ